MTPAAFRAALEALNWLPRTLAEILECDNRFVQHWAAGQLSIPPSVAAWLSTLAAAHIASPPPEHWRSETMSPIRRDPVAVVALGVDGKINAAVQKAINATLQRGGWVNVNFAKAMHLVVAGSVSVKVGRTPRRSISGAGQLSVAVNLLLRVALAEHDAPQPFSTNAVRLTRSGQAIYDKCT